MAYMYTVFLLLQSIRQVDVYRVKYTGAFCSLTNGITTVEYQEIHVINVSMMEAFPTIGLIEINK